MQMASTRTGPLYVGQLDVRVGVALVRRSCRLLSGSQYLRHRTCSTFAPARAWTAHAWTCCELIFVVPVQFRRLPRLRREERLSCSAEASWPAPRSLGACDPGLQSGSASRLTSDDSKGAAGSRALAGP